MIGSVARPDPPASRQPSEPRMDGFELVLDDGEVSA